MKKSQRDGISGYGIYRIDRRQQRPYAGVPFVAPEPAFDFSRPEVCVHAQDQTLQAAKCDVCGTPVTLHVRPLTAAQMAWRWFECPHCRKPNFIRIAGQILKVVGQLQES